MTDRDKIELPPLPGEYYQFSKGETLDYARAAVLADRERRPCVGASEGERIAELVKALEHAQREVLDMKIKDAEDRTCRAEQAKPAGPKVHEARVVLTRNGYAWAPDGVAPPVTSLGSIVATLCWTDDGRAWIESERNRELAQWLRMWRGAIGNEAADALDGGAR